MKDENGRMKGAKRTRCLVYCTSAIEVQCGSVYDAMLFRFEDLATFHWNTFTCNWMFWQRAEYEWAIMDWLVINPALKGRRVNVPHEQHSNQAKYTSTYTTKQFFWAAYFWMTLSVSIFSITLYTAVVLVHNHFVCIHMASKLNALMWGFEFLNGDMKAIVRQLS